MNETYSGTDEFHPVQQRDTPGNDMQADFCKKSSFPKSCRKLRKSIRICGESVPGGCLSGSRLEERLSSVRGRNSDFPPPTFEISPYHRPFIIFVMKKKFTPTTEGKK